MIAALAGCAPDAPRGKGAERATTGGAPPATASPAWVVRTDGAGPLRVGMSIAEARAALGGDLSAPDRAASCDYVFSRRTPAGVAIMVVDGRVARVDVDGGEVATAEGARVGDTEARVRALYPGRVEVSPHEYTDGHYLTVAPATPADSAHRIVFETDGARVTQYRAGAMPAVGWVEGCS